jgi:hypothetical protein
VVWLTYDRDGLRRRHVVARGEVRGFVELEDLPEVFR